MKSFTDRYLKSLKPKDKKYSVHGGQGLAIQVFPNGKKAWTFSFQLNKRRRMMGLGSYPEISVKDAHTERDKAKEFLAKGVDPLAHREEQIRQQAEEEIRKAQELTIQTLVDRYLEEWAKPRKRSWKEDQRILFLDVAPVWGERKAKDITRRDVRELITVIKARGPVMARNSLAVIKKMFNWSLSEDLVETNPAHGITPPPPAEPRTRVLTEEEIKLFWEKLDSASMAIGTKAALRLILVTAQRPGEVVGMQWADVQVGVWEISAENSKNGRPNRVPLSPKAMEVLDALPKTSQWVFPSPSRFKKGLGHVHETSLPHALGDNRDHFEMPAFRPHDLRRSGASHLSALGVPRFVVDRILNHVDRSVTGAHYDQYEFTKEKKNALDVWGRKLEEIITGKTENDSAQGNRIRILDP